MSVAAANGTDEVQDAQAEVLDVGQDGTADQNWTQATATAQQNESDAESSAYQTLSQNTAALDAAYQNYEANSDAQTIAGLDPASPWGKLASAKAAAHGRAKGSEVELTPAGTSATITTCHDESEQVQVGSCTMSSIGAWDGCGCFARRPTLPRWRKCWRMR